MWCLCNVYVCWYNFINKKGIFFAVCSVVRSNLVYVCGVLSVVMVNVTSCLQTNLSYAVCRMHETPGRKREKQNETTNGNIPAVANISENQRPKHEANSENFYKMVFYTIKLYYSLSLLVEKGLPFLSFSLLLSFVNFLGISCSAIALWNTIMNWFNYKIIHSFFFSSLFLIFT